MTILFFKKICIIIFLLGSSFLLPTCSNSQGVQGLHSSWIEQVSPDGKTYYFNTITKQSQWLAPVTSSDSRPKNYFRPRKPHHRPITRDSKSSLRNHSIEINLGENATVESIGNFNDTILANSFSDAKFITSAIVDNTLFISNNESNITSFFVESTEDSISSAVADYAYADLIVDRDTEQVSSNESTSSVAPLLFEYTETKSQMESLRIKFAYHIQENEHLKSLLDEKEDQLQLLTSEMNSLINELQEAQSESTFLSESNRLLQSELENLHRELEDIELRDKSRTEVSSMSIDPNSVGLMIDALTANITYQISAREALQAKIEMLDSDLQIAHETIDELADRLQALANNPTPPLASDNRTTWSSGKDSVLLHLLETFLRPLKVAVEVAQTTLGQRKRRSYREWIMGSYADKQKLRVEALLNQTTENQIDTKLESSEPEADNVIGDSHNDSAVLSEDESDPNFLSNLNLEQSAPSLSETDSSEQNFQSPILERLEAENFLLRENLTALTSALSSKTDALLDLAAEAQSYLSQSETWRKRCERFESEVLQLSQEKRSLSSELEQKEMDFNKLDESYRSQESLKDELAIQLERALLDSESSQQRYQESIFSLSDRLQLAEERCQAAEEINAQRDAESELLRKELAEAMAYQQRLRDQLLNTSLQLADLKRWQAVSLVDEQLKETAKNNSKIEEPSQRPHRRKLFGLF